MLDLEKLRRDIIDINIMALYDFMEPVSVNEIGYMGGTNKAIERYQRDHIFHARVTCLVSETMQVIQKHNKE